MTVNDIYKLYSRESGSTWVAGYDAWIDVLKLRYSWGEYVVSPLYNIGELPTLFGLPVVFDRGMDDHTIEFRTSTGDVIGKIVDIG